MQTTSKNNLQSLIKKIKDQPGIYKMYNQSGDLLYIGKSIHLDKRVKSYFTKKVNRSRKVQRMVKQVSHIEVVYTDTELDALLLECQLIQHLQPPYNTVMTRNHKYKYFQFDECPKPVLKVTKKPNIKAPLVIGPLSNRKISQQAYQYILKYYPYFCSGKKQNLIGVVNYNLPEQVVQDFITHSLVTLDMEEQLTRQMDEYAQLWAYEKAQEILQCLQGLKYLKYMYTLAEDLKETSYIGRLPVAKSFKYYLVHEGRLLTTKIGDSEEEKEIIEALKETLEATKKVHKKIILQDEIDQILILQRFKKSKMYRIKV